jgi:hypothetical protein
MVALVVVLQCKGQGNGSASVAAVKLHVYTADFCASTLTVGQRQLLHACQLSLPLSWGTWLLSLRVLLSILLSAIIVVWLKVHLAWAVDFNTTGLWGCSAFGLKQIWPLAATVQWVHAIHHQL